MIWTRTMLKDLKLAYKIACECEMDVFRFEGHDFVVSYARYLIEYLEGQFKSCLSG